MLCLGITPQDHICHFLKAGIFKKGTISMKNFMTTTAVLAAMTAATTANAQGMGGDFYASVFGGYSLGDVTTEGELSGYNFDVTAEGESGYILGLTVGTTVAPNIRAEAEVSYAAYAVDTLAISYSGGGYDIDASEADVSTTATYLLANVWYDIPNVAGGSGIAPYVGGGVGYGVLTGKVDDGGEVDLFDDAGGIAFQIGAGIQVPVGAGMIDVGYRFKGVTGGETDNFVLEDELDEISSTSNTFQAGYVLKF